jgi:hypothetical protein
MPTYDGIGSSITHRVEVVGDSLFQDVDGGTLSTKVPVQIFSNYYASPGSVDSSRQLRFRVQPDGESNVSNSYVTDMGVKGADGSNYFFITAPQNTSNVGDQNTFVISTASNVGIGTTDPVTTLQVVGDIKCQTLTASNIVGGSPLTISADSISINAPVTMPADAPMEIGTMTVSNIFHSDQLTMSAHVAMGSDKTLTTSNLVANTGDNLLISSNLEVGTSNLFVDTTTGRVGIGTDSPGKKLTIYDTNPFTELRASTEGHGSTLLLGTPYSATSPSKVGIIAQGISNFSRAKLHFCLDDNSSNDPAYAASVSNSRMTIQPNGNVGIGVTNPDTKLHLKNPPSVSAYGNYRSYIHMEYGSGNWIMAVDNNTSINHNLYWYANLWPSGTIANVITFENDKSQNTVVNANFTGQHRTFIKNIPYEFSTDYKGMIVSSDNNQYIKMSGGIAKGMEAITINETLPLVSLSNVARDKKCFGVISDAEDPNERVDSYGRITSHFTKEEGDTRVYINSVGEGAIWVVNTNGNLESGDYITTSDVAGYGMKQDDDILHNYTVAKITMDCDFNPPQQPVQIILKDAEGNNILDQYGQIQWVDDPDGATEPAYKTRQLEGGYIAAFVGCTYHCG